MQRKPIASIVILAASAGVLVPLSSTADDTVRVALTAHNEYFVSFAAGAVNQALATSLSSDALDGRRRVAFWIDMILSRVPRIGIDASPELVQVMKFLMNRPHLCGDFLKRSDDHQRRRIVLHIDLLTRGDLV